METILIIILIWCISFLYYKYRERQKSKHIWERIEEEAINNLKKERGQSIYFAVWLCDRILEYQEMIRIFKRDYWDEYNKYVKQKK